MAMSHDEFRDALAALGMTQRDAAGVLMVDERTSRRWALGESEIPGPVEVLIRLWRDNSRTLETTRRILAERAAAEAKGARKAARR